MCATCGCDTGSKTTFHLLDKDQQQPQDHKFVHAHPHDHAHTHGEDHDHPHVNSKTIIDVERDVLSQNNLLAQRNRGYFDAKNILSLNLVSSPGSGKSA